MQTEQAVTHWYDMYQELAEKGTADMHVLTDDRSMAVQEDKSAEGHEAMLQQDISALRDEARAHEVASKDGVAGVVRSSEEQIAGIRDVHDWTCQGVGGPSGASRASPTSPRWRRFQSTPEPRHMPCGEASRSARSLPAGPSSVTCSCGGLLAQR